MAKITTATWCTDEKDLIDEFNAFVTANVTNPTLEVDTSRPKMLFVHYQLRKEDGASDEQIADELSTLLNRE